MEETPIYFETLKDHPEIRAVMTDEEAAAWDKEAGQDWLVQ